MSLSLFSKSLSEKIKVLHKVKFKQLPAATAKPGNPISPILATKGFASKVKDFCLKFNEITNEFLKKSNLKEAKIDTEVFLLSNDTFFIKIKGRSFFSFIKPYIIEKTLKKSNFLLAAENFFKEKLLLLELENKDEQTFKSSFLNKDSVFKQLESSLKSNHIKLEE